MERETISRAGNKSQLETPLAVGQASHNIEKQYLQCSIAFRSGKEGWGEEKGQEHQGAFISREHRRKGYRIQIFALRLQNLLWEKKQCRRGIGEELPTRARAILDLFFQIFRFEMLYSFKIENERENSRVSGSEGCALILGCSGEKSPDFRHGPVRPVSTRLTKPFSLPIHRPIAGVESSMIFSC